MTNLHLLKNLVGAVRHPKGTVIADDTGTPTLYIVLHGAVGELRQDGVRTTVANHNPGDFFGLGMLTGRPAATAVALTDTITLPITKDGLPAFLQSEPAYAVELLRELYTQLEAVDDSYALLTGHRFTAPAPHTPAPEPTEELPAAEPQIEAPTTEQSNIEEEAKEAAAPAPSPSISVPRLFPEGHGSYQLELYPGDRTYLMEKSYACPVCKQQFRSLKVKASRLVSIGTDSDLRARFKGVEPLYYDVTTCPQCLYSAPEDLFAQPDYPKAALPQVLAALKATGELSIDLERDTTSVFAGYYLALLCAPNFLPRHPLTVPNLLLKLYRLYQDCGDTQMEERLAQQALDAHLNVYETIELTEEHEQEVQLLLAELSMRLGKWIDARKFFFNVKRDRNCPPVLRAHADDRIDEIRERLAKEKGLK